MEHGFIFTGPLIAALNPSRLPVSQLTIIENEDDESALKSYCFSTTPELGGQHVLLISESSNSGVHH